MSRLIAAGAIALAVLAGPAVAGPFDDFTGPLDVSGGTVVGVKQNGIDVFKGIPYAAPPVRELRWQDPQPVAAWKGTLVADRYAPMCMQGLRAKNSVFYQGEEPVSEDCLYLNVWTKEAGMSGARRPVMVFVFGGGWVVGSGSMPIYDGSGLAAKDAVVVTFNYRIGTMGFFAHPELKAESKDGTAGNYGLKDVLAVLEWVKANAAQFGGDPANVTVYGQSAGAQAISLLMASPLSKDLFQRAIGESGGYTMGGKMAGLDETAAKGTAFAEKMKAASLADLRNLGADAIIAADNSFRPIVDGRVFTEQPSTTFADGRQMKIPLLAGSNSDEGTAYPVAKPAEKFTAEAKERYGDRADAFLKLYPAGTDAEARASSYALMRDQVFATAVRNWAKDQAGIAPTFVYYYSNTQPFAAGQSFQQQKDPADFGAYHGSEMVYAYDILDTANQIAPTRGWTAEDRALADTLSSYWVNFSRTGDPNGANLPQWPAYKADGEQALLIGKTAKAGALPNTDKLDFLAR